MTTLHPHWQSTDDADEQRVRVTARSSSSRPTNVPQASRRPAAFVGIFLFLIVGVAALQGFGLSALRGQIDPTATVVHITAAGADPLTITVQPGSTITWTNDDTIPHVLSSDTLPTVDGKPFSTSPIFPGSSTHFLVPLTATAGTYPYISKTSATVSGQIIITAAGSAPLTSSAASTVSFASSSVSSETSSALPAFVPSTDATSSLPAFTAPATQPDLSASVSTGIPVNPHTVGTDNSLPVRQDSTGGTPITQHIPRSAPSTGPDVWITVLLSMGAMLLVTRGAFKQA